ncbi:hypothetical protein D3C83_73020 [compost metagenome]
MNADQLLRVMAKVSDAELASMLTIASMEYAYRKKVAVSEVTAAIGGIDPWTPAEHPTSHEVRMQLTVAGSVWESITGRRFRRHRMH